MKEINDILQDYYDGKITKDEATVKLKALGIDILIKFLFVNV